MLPWLRPNKTVCCCLKPIYIKGAIKQKVLLIFNSIHDAGVEQTNTNLSSEYCSEYLSDQAVALQGEQPPIGRLLSLHNMLTGSSTELRQPINLEQQLLQKTGADSEVAASMVQLLQVSS